jgi:hypothetical protein
MGASCPKLTAYFFTVTMLPEWWQRIRGAALRLHFISDR